MLRFIARGALLSLLTVTPSLAAASVETFQVTPRDPSVVRIVAYGDQRFTDPSEKDASRPLARQALVQRIAEEPSDAILMTGDVPWHGGTSNDYTVFQQETSIWTERHLHVFPTLGNHEFAGCSEAECLAHWWQANPRFAGLRWYAVDIGSQVRAIALDTMLPFTFGSPQRIWLEAQINSLPTSTHFVVLYLHHPPVAAHELDPLRHNVRPSEVILADYLTERAKTLHARIIVVAGHIHNYEHHERDGVVYLVSGGGGAKPYPVSRAGDLYQGTAEPNFHFLTLNVAGEHMHIEMHRLEDHDGPHPHQFAVRDAFDVLAPTKH
jgi:hypothetical protein